MELVDEVIRSRRKTLSIKIARDGKVIVYAPLSYSDFEIEKFVESKRNWIIKYKEKTLKTYNFYDTKNLTEGSEIYLLGNKYIIKLRPQKNIEIDGNYVILPVKYANSIEMHLKKWLIELSNVVLKDRLFELGNKLGFSNFSYKTSSARQKWGSCSREGEIMLNFRLLLCPKEIIDYVIMHELTHLLYFNHQSGFYNYLFKICPKAKEYKAWLKENSGILSSY